MCNHIYEAKNQSLPRDIKIKCEYSVLYFQNSLPVDDQGKCLFHSENIEWKRKNKFNDKFLKLFEAINNDDNVQYFDLRDFVFVGELISDKDKKLKYQLSLENLEINKQIYFDSSIFEDPFLLKGVDIKGGTSFKNVIFKGKIIIDECKFDGADFTNSKFLDNAHFGLSLFKTYTLFENAKFLSELDGYVVKFNDLSFDGMVDFSNSVIDLKSAESVFGFSNVKFNDVVDFRQTQFHNQLVFSDTFFASTAEFIDTYFGVVKSSALYVGSAVEFNRIEVGEKAKLNFLSTDSQKKMFNHTVQMSFKDNLKGIIQFENVNFNQFSPKSKERLLRLAKSNNVEIKKGCLKYRWQTEIRSVDVSEGNVSLVQEICQTFTNYFTVSNGINLGFEIVERTSSNISFFYFTDENIKEEEFFEYLKRTDKEFWDLLTYNNIQSISESTKLTNKKKSIINAVDGISALMGTFFRVGIRISCGEWNETNTKSLLESINFSNDSGILERSKNLHSVLVDKYSGESIFTFNDKQNKELKIVSNTYNLNGPNSRVNNNSVDYSRNVVNEHTMIDEKISLLREEIKNLVSSLEQQNSALEIVDAIEKQVESDKPSNAVLSALVKQLPKVGNIASLGSFILSCFSG